jgi:HAD superfamily hydrolase (TIGR01450 family)
MKNINPNALDSGQIIRKQSSLTASHHRQIVILASSKKMTPVTSIKRISSINELPKHYKAVLLDQFGVLHNGIEPYGPQSISALDTLTAMGCKVLLLSNSSRRSSGALTNLQRMGFNIASLLGVITSGEVTHNFLTHNLSTLPGTTAFHFTWSSRGAISLEGLDLNLTTDITKADFILAHGTEAVGTSVDGSDPTPTSVEDMLSLLSTAASLPQRPPLIVANPDIVTVHGNSGELRTMPGTLAKHYANQLSLQENNNNNSADTNTTNDLIMLMGKPASIIYHQALELLGNLDPSEVIAIGDSLEHDIAGAAAAGIESVFIAGGIHRTECGMTSDDSELDEEAMERLFDKFNCRPTYICPMFQ